MKQYQLRCIAPDGEYKTEGEDFPSVESAWQRADDMGSRWFFYPVNVVTGKDRIISVPHGMSQDWIGKSFRRLCRAFAAESEHVCDWINGKDQLGIYP